MTEIWLELFNNEIYFFLSRLAMMSDFTGFISCSNHRVAHIIDDKNQSAILGLRNNNTMLERQSSFLEHNMCSSSSLNSLLNVIIWSWATLPYTISMDSGTIDGNFALDFKCLIIEKILQLRSNNFALFIFNKLLELNVISKRYSFHSRNVIINCGCKQAVQIHPRVNHLCFAHKHSILTMQVGQIRVHVNQLPFRQNSWGREHFHSVIVLRLD